MKYKKEVRIFMDSMGYDLERQRTHLVFRHYVGFTLLPHHHHHALML